MNRGFTLVELLIVITILGIASAIAIPSITEMRRTGSEARATAALKGELMPACLQFQNLYNPTRDVDNDLLGDFPLHPACLAGGQAGLNAESATAAAPLAADLLDRAVWGNANGYWLSSQRVNLRLPNGSVLNSAPNGASVDGYDFGFLTGGVPSIYYTDGDGAATYEFTMRDMMITAFARPTEEQYGIRSFAISINPFFYRGMLVQTVLPESYSPYQTWYMAYNTTMWPGGPGAFYNPAGVPLEAPASAATGGVPVPGRFRLNTAMAKQMQ